MALEAHQRVLRLGEVDAFNDPSFVVKDCCRAGVSHLHRKPIDPKLTWHSHRLIRNHEVSVSSFVSCSTTPIMLVLAETAIGFVVFKLSSDAKLDNKELWREFESPEGANKL